MLLAVPPPWFRQAYELLSAIVVVWEGLGKCFLVQITTNACISSSVNPILSRPKPLVPRHLGDRNRGRYEYAQQITVPPEN